MLLMTNHETDGVGGLSVTTETEQAKGHAAEGGDTSPQEPSALYVATIFMEEYAEVFEELAK